MVLGVVLTIGGVVLGGGVLLEGDVVLGERPLAEFRASPGGFL